MRILVCFTLLLFHTYSLFAQDIEVKKFELMENGQTTALTPRKDINGNDCAIVLVHTLKRSMKFEGWTGGKYHNDGYLFLLWDFSDENAPQIHVCTWQPDKIGGKPLPKDEVFSLSDFDI